MSEEKKQPPKPQKKAEPDDGNEKLLKMMAELVASSQSSRGLDPRRPKPMEEYRFWKTQPVPRVDAKVDNQGAIENKTTEQVLSSAQKLPAGFEWCNLTVTDDKQLDEIYQLLFENYIEDVEERFRFKYSVPFLRWALKPPGWQPEWSVGIRASDSGKLLAFISAVPATLSVRKAHVKAVEINFLCVHKKLRSKRMAPVLIKEITRQVNLKNIWQALFTAGTFIPTPVSTTRYYHRILSWQKLYDVGFTFLPPGSTPEAQIAKNDLPAANKLEGFRRMTPEDIPAVARLLSSYLEKFELSQVFTEEELSHYLLGDCVYAYVVESEDKKITDFNSFYKLESSVLGNTKHSSITVGYSYYYATSVSEPAQLKERLTQLFEATLIEAKKAGLDVYNALTLLDNPLFLDELNFGAGDGLLYYNLFNYKTLPINGGIQETGSLGSPGGVAVVLL